MTELFPCQVPPPVERLPALPDPDLFIIMLLIVLRHGLILESVVRRDGA
jgi:hypothetical protein